MDFFEKPRSLDREDLADMLLPKEFTFELNWTSAQNGVWECSVKGLTLRANATQWSVSQGTKVIAKGTADGEAETRVAAEEVLDQFIIWDEKFRDKITSYIDKLGRAYSQRVGLFIWGPPSSGKTAAAAVVAKAARRRYHPALFIHVWELRDAIRGRLMYKADKTPLDRAKEVELLVLDGLDEGDRDEKMILTLLDIERLVTARAKQNKLTILTTQIDPQVVKTDPKWKKFYNSIKTYVITLQAPDAQEANDKRAELNSKLLDKDES